MVTMMFESSLQAVNPKLSLPYWDFTIEADTIDNEYDGDYTKLREASDLWTSEWFGSVDNADFQVRDGERGMEGEFLQYISRVAYGGPSNSC